MISAPEAIQHLSYRVEKLEQELATLQVSHETLAQLTTQLALSVQMIVQTLLAATKKEGE